MAFLNPDGSVRQLTEGFGSAAFPDVNTEEVIPPPELGFTALRVTKVARGLWRSHPQTVQPGFHRQQEARSAPPQIHRRWHANLVLPYLAIQRSSGKLLQAGQAVDGA